MAAAPSSIIGISAIIIVSVVVSTVSILGVRSRTEHRLSSPVPPSMGPTGVIGPAGPQGPTSNAIGPTGDTGLTGPHSNQTGPSGVTGMTGQTGPVGGGTPFVGPTGVIGLTGSTGPQGQTGATGILIPVPAYVIANFALYTKDDPASPLYPVGGLYSAVFYTYGGIATGMISITAPILHQPNKLQLYIQFTNLSFEQGTSATIGVFRGIVYGLNQIVSLSRDKVNSNQLVFWLIDPSGTEIPLTLKDNVSSTTGFSIDLLVTGIP